MVLGSNRLVKPHDHNSALHASKKRDLNCKDVRISYKGLVDHDNAFNRQYKLFAHA